jgi:putative hydrolase of HD superfamily
MMDEEIAKYLYEMGQLKRVKRSGWWLAGITDPESVAEHSFRTAVLGYILAHLEGADPARTAALCLFHDTPEARFNDLHKLAQRYLDMEKGEALAVKEQVSRLPQKIADDVASLIQHYNERDSLEARLAHDADLLECLIQAREYQTQGYTDVQDWIDSCKAGLKSEASKRLAETCLRIEPRTWFEGLRKTLS